MRFYISCDASCTAKKTARAGWTGYVPSGTSLARSIQGSFGQIGLLGEHEPFYLHLAVPSKVPKGQCSYMVYSIYLGIEKQYYIMTPVSIYVPQWYLDDLGM